jgi:hypothetical protein
VRRVLETLREYGLNCKAEKCEFSVKNWPTPASAKDMQVLVGFMNFYRHFVKKRAKVTSNRRFTKEIEREVGVYRGTKKSRRNQRPRRMRDCRRPEMDSHVRRRQPRYKEASAHVFSH